MVGLRCLDYLRLAARLWSIWFIAVCTHFWLALTQILIPLAVINLWKKANQLGIKFQSLNLGLLFLVLMQNISKNVVKQYQMPEFIGVRRTPFRNSIFLFMISVTYMVTYIYTDIKKKSSIPDILGFYVKSGWTFISQEKIPDVIKMHACELKGQKHSS